MTQPTPEIVRSFWQHMSQSYGSTVRDKATAEEMQLFAKGLDKMGIVNGAEFLSRFVTTIGSTIYTPFTPGEATETWPLWDQIVVCAHEHQHVLQSDQSLSFTLKYLSDPVWRAAYEGSAYRVSMTLDFWHYGKTPVTKPYLEAAKSYGLDTPSLDFFQQYLELSIPAIRQHGKPDEAARVAIEWLEQNAPELKG